MDRGSMMTDPQRIEYLCGKHDKRQLAEMLIESQRKYDYSLDVLIRYVRSVVKDQEKRKRY